MSQKENQDIKKEEVCITRLVLRGIKENDEKIDIALDKEFNKDTYEYFCNVTHDIKSLEIEKEAGTNSVKIIGLDEFKEGENVVTLEVKGQGDEVKTYTIKVIKESDNTIETVAPMKQDNYENKEKEQRMISMPLWGFIMMQIVIIVVEIGIIWVVMRRLK